jgi:hypothetical protein
MSVVERPEFDRKHEIVVGFDLGIERETIRFPDIPPEEEVGNYLRRRFPHVIACPETIAQVEAAGTAYAQAFGLGLRVEYCEVRELIMLVVREYDLGRVEL